MSLPTPLVLRMKNSRSGICQQRPGEAGPGVVQLANISKSFQTGAIGVGTGAMRMCSSLPRAANHQLGNTRQDLPNSRKAALNLWYPTCHMLPNSVPLNRGRYRLQLNKAQSWPYSPGDRVSAANCEAKELPGRYHPLSLPLSSLVIG